MAPYIPSGKSFVALLPAVASLAAPTGPEIAAGVILTQPNHSVVARIVEMNGWETDAGNVKIPDVASNFTGSIPGRVDGGEGTITLYDDDASTTIRAANAEGTVGFMFIAKAGKVTGRRCEVWPVTVSSINDSQVNSGADPSTFTVKYAQTAKPAKNAVCP